MSEKTIRAVDWLIDMAATHTNHLANDLLLSSQAAVGARMQQETRGDESKYQQWLEAFAKRFPSNFRPAQFAFKGDLKKLTGAERLAAANGEPLLHIRREGK